MSRIVAGTNIDRVSEDKRPRYIAIALNDIRSVVNGGLSFADNFSAQTLILNFSGAVNVLFSHNLKRVPVGYLITRLTSPAIIYDGTSPGTDEFFSLRSSAACVATVLLF